MMKKIFWLNWLNIKYKNEYSILHTAVVIGNVEIFEKLVFSFIGYNKNVLIELLKDKNKFGNSVLHI